MPQDPDGLIPARIGHAVMLEADGTQLRLAALDFALRYPPKQSAERVTEVAATYLAFLQGDSNVGSTDTMVNVRDAEILLHQYSEWLDADLGALQLATEAGEPSHDNLVASFLAQRNPNSIPYLGDPRP